MLLVEMVSLLVDEFCHLFLSLVASHSLSLGINAICRGSIANNVAKGRKRTSDLFNTSEMC